MNLSTIIIVAYSLLIVLIATLYFFSGLKKGFINMTVRLAFIGLSVLLSMLITNILVNVFSPKIQTLIDGFITGEISEYLNSLPALRDYVYSLGGAIVSPVVFLIVFIVVCLLMKIPCAIITGILKKVSENRSVQSTSSLPKLFGAAVACICAFSITACVSMPVLGYLDIIKTVYPVINQNGTINESTAGGVLNQVLVAGDSGIIKFETAVGKPLFNGLTKVEVENGKSESVTKELDVALNIYEKGIKLAKTDFSDISKTDLTPLNDLVETVAESENLSVVTAEFLSVASSKWCNNEAFLGIDLSKMLNQDLQPAAEVLLSDFKETNKESLVGDVKELIASMQSVVKISYSLSSFSMTGDLSQVDFTPIEVCVDEIENSEKLSEVMAVVMNSAATKWKANESFMGVQLKENLNDDLVGAVDALLTHFEQSDKTTVCNDLTEFISCIKTVTNFAETIQSINFDSADDIDTVGINDFTAKVESGGDMIKDVIAALLNKAGTDWDNGEDFMEINLKEELPVSAGTSFQSTYEELKGANRTNVVKVLNNLSAKLESYKYVMKLADDTLSAEDIKNNLADFVSTINADNVDVLKNAITSEMLADAGIKAENASVYSEILSGTLTGISTMDDDKKQQESEALNTVLSYAKGEPGAVSDREVVSAIVGSESISQTVKEMSASGSIAVSGTEAEKALIEKAINDYSAENVVTPEEQETLDAIRKLYGIS